MIRPWDGTVPRVLETMRVIPPVLEFGERIETMRDIEETYSGVEGVLASPEEFITDLRETSREVVTLNSDWQRAAVAQRLDAETARAWNLFLASWETFLTETETGWNERQPRADWDPIRRGMLFVFVQGQNTRLEDFKAQVRRWRETLTQRTGITPSAPGRTPAPAPSDIVTSPESPLRGAMAEFKPILIGGLVVAGGITLLLLIRTVKP